MFRRAAATTVAFNVGEVPIPENAVSSWKRSIVARKYSKAASKKVQKAMEERKKGTLKSGRSGRKVTSRKQAIAIGLSEARREGKKVPKKKKKS